MLCWQKRFTLRARSRGFHLVHDEVLTEIREGLQTCSMGTLNLFLQHSSASLAINENYDPSVRADMESFFNQNVPENAPYYTHILEGSDDMPAHIKSVIMGVSLTLPITNGTLNLGTWQGIYLNEHRDHAESRNIVATITGI